MGLEKEKNAIMLRGMLNPGEGPFTPASRITDSVPETTDHPLDVPVMNPERRGIGAEHSSVLGSVVHHPRGSVESPRLDKGAFTEGVEGNERLERMLLESVGRVDSAHTMLMTLVLQHPEVILSDIDGKSFEDSVAADMDQVKVLAASGGMDAVEQLQAVEDNFREYIRAIQKAIEADQAAHAFHNKVVLPTSAGTENLPVVLSAEGEETNIEDQLKKLQILVNRWKTLQSQCLRGRLSGAMKRAWKGDVIPTRKATEWLDTDGNPKKWSLNRQKHFIGSVLHPMEKWVELAEELAPGLQGENQADETRQPSGDQASKSPSHSVPSEQNAGYPPLIIQEKNIPPTASVVTLDRRPVIDGKLTEWERMDSVEQSRLRRELYARKDHFLSGLNKQLKRAGVGDLERRSTIIKYLDEYLLQVIPLVVKIPLQDTDRESLLRDLKKEIAIA